MTEKRRFFSLIGIMIVACLTVTGISLRILYGTAIEVERDRLTETAQSQARLIEAVARFDRIYSNDYPTGSFEATLSQIRDAHQNYKGFGMTGEFTLARREGDQIIFLLSHRHHDLNNLQPVAFDSRLAEPMRRALSGKSGTITGLDYRGEKVLAAYEPLKALGMGIVAKIDLTEIRAPFIHAAMIVVVVMALVVLAGAVLFLKISNPIIRKLKEQNRNLRQKNQELSEVIESRKQAEAALSESEKKYRLLFEKMINGFALHEIVLNKEGEAVDYLFVEVNAAFEQLTGLKADEIIGKKVTEVLPGIENDPANWIGRYGEVALTGQEIRFEQYSEKLEQYFSVLAFAIRKGRFATIFEDITERKLNEQRIEHLNRVLRSIRDINQLIVRERNPETLIREGCRLLVENRGYVSALIVLTDETGRPVNWAASGVTESLDSMKTMFEGNELPSCIELRSGSQVVLIDDWHTVCRECSIGEECAAGTSLYVPLVHEDTDFGHLVVALSQGLGIDDEETGLFAEMAGDLAYALNFLRVESAQKASERRHRILEGQLLQAQKMESVGRLAGGVAHDYNNMLSIISGNAELALEKLKPEDDLYEDLVGIKTAANRSADITRQLLAFARQQTIVPKVVDLNSAVESRLKMFRRLIGENIDFTWEPGAELWPVKIDPAQIDQILANLCVNARDAITDVGKVTVETKNVGFDETYCADHEGFVPGKYVMLAVSDNGAGMTAEIQEKIFEPFFTTKAPGKGTGLGLSTVYGIVKQNHGFINVYSEPGKGTTIKIYLPRHEGTLEDTQDESHLEIPLGRGETVLMVEDNVAILKLGIRMLKSLGYTVLSAAAPVEAANLAATHEGTISLLITDVVMPEMNGRELSEQLKQRYPDLKTIFMSGYTANVIAHQGVLDKGVHFLQKPFSKSQLAVKAREALDNGSG